ncbi:hypothetical protein [Streptomyces sp. NPDC060194]|uniref:hypothetical protein n=1 Tax=Streptomyces sp. NPDC060194 TaxID=3347069 RepID=UPI003655E188
MPFVVGDVAGGEVVEFLPDRAGQVIVHAHPPGALGPWEGTAVLAASAAAAAVAGWLRLRRRDT